jgi:hypothetical protein
MLRFSQNLLIGLLFLLQGVAPLVHAHAGGSGTSHGIHVDGLSQALPDAGTDRTHSRARDDESPGFGVATSKRNDERALQPVELLAAPPARPEGCARAFPSPSGPACAAAHATPHLHPASRAPPHPRMS